MKINSKHQELLTICIDLCVDRDLYSGGTDFNIFQEFRFHPKRKWRFDIAIPKLMIGIELDGGVWISGRHNRPSGFLKDMEKFNEAVISGWRILRFTPEEVGNGIAEDTIGRLIDSIQQNY